MTEIEILKEELFCTRYEARIFAGFINYGKLERWMPDFSDFTTEDSHIKRYELAKQFIKGKKVLDIACGSGRGSYMMAEAGAAEVVAVDLDAEAIRYASHRHKHDNITFIQGNAEQFIKENYFDIIISFETIEHLNNVEAYLKCISASLKTGGTYLVSTPIAGVPHDVSPKNISHVQEWGFDKFQNIIKSYFSIKGIYVQLYQYEETGLKDTIASILNKLKIKRRNLSAKRISTISVYDSNNVLNKKLLGKQVKGYQILICTKS